MTNFLKNKFGIYQEPRQELPSWLSEVETLSFDYAQEPASRINTYKFPHHAYKQRN
jgi:hypothetical protein